MNLLHESPALSTSDLRDVRRAAEIGGAVAYLTNGRLSLRELASREEVRLSQATLGRALAEWHIEIVVDGIQPLGVTAPQPGEHVANTKLIHSMVIDEPRDVCAIVWVDSDGYVTIGATTDGVVWETQQVPEQPQAVRWQPQIATNASDETPLSQDLLAVTWYEQPDGDPSTSVKGSISDDGGVT